MGKGLLLRERSGLPPDTQQMCSNSTSRKVGPVFPRVSIMHVKICSPREREFRGQLDSRAEIAPLWGLTSVKPVKQELVFCAEEAL